MADNTNITDVDNGDIQIIEVSTGLRGESVGFFTGTMPPSNALGGSGDIYLVTQGTTGLGNVYQKSDGTWSLEGNIRGPGGSGTGQVESVNSKTGQVIITGDDITSGKLPISVIPTGVTAATVALGNHSHNGTYEPSLTIGTTGQYLRGDKTWQALNKGTIGLSDVDNTSDAAKPISTAVQTALNAKAATAHTHALTDASITGVLPIAKIPTGTTGSTVALGNHVHVIANVTGLQAILDEKESVTGAQAKATAAETNAKQYADGVIQTIVGAAPTTLDTLNELAAALGNNPNFATTVASQIAAKESTIAAGTIAQYYRGDKTWQTLDASAVGLGNIDNTSDLDKPISSATQTALNLKSNSAHTHAGTDITSGTVPFARLPVAAAGAATSGMLVAADDPRLGVNTPAEHTHDNLYFTESEILSLLGLKAAVDHTHTIVNVTGLQAALNAKEPALGSGSANTFLSAARTWIAITPSIVGLGNVNNTSDANKPVSTATSSAIATSLQSAKTYTDNQIALIPQAPAGEPVITAGTEDQYFRGDKTWQPLSLVVVDRTSDQNIMGVKTFANIVVNQGALKVGTSAVDGQVLVGDTSGYASWGNPSIIATKLGTANASTYRQGVYAQEVATEVGWPDQYSTILTSYVNTNRALQISHSKTIGALPKVRSADSAGTNGWTAWTTLSDDSKVVHTTGNETLGGTKTFSSAPIVPVNAFAIDRVNGLQTVLSQKPSYGANLVYGNPFGGQRVYINELHNTMFAANIRWNVVGKLYRKSDNVEMSTLGQGTLGALFDGDYEVGINIPLGQYLVVNITFPSGAAYPGYPYGQFLVSHYHTSRSESQAVRFFTTFAAHGGPVWKVLPKTNESDLPAAYVVSFRNDSYGITEMEFRFDSPDTGTVAQVTQIEMKPDRPGLNERPYIEKYRAQTLYYNTSWKNSSSATVNASITSSGIITGTFFYGNGANLTGLTKTQVGLANVDNTTDAAKPISMATQLALNGKAADSHGHVLTDANITGVLPLAQMPTHTHTKSQITDFAHGHDLTDANITGVLPIAQIPTGTTAATVALGNHVHTTANVTGLDTALADKPSRAEMRTRLEGPNVALAPLYGALANRNFRPARIMFLGSSTTYGLAATADKFRYVDQTIHSIQSAYPSAIPGHFPSPQTLSEGVTGNNPSPLPGVQGYNGGTGGANSRNYVTSGHLYGIGILNPDCFVHMIGSNDSISHVDYAVPVAEYKTNVETAINSIDALSATGTPACHVLVHAYRRSDVTEAHWATYGAALREIADSRTNVIFVDMDSAYKHNKMPGTDPYSLLSPDAVHQTDRGHAFMADQLLRAMGLASKGSPDDSMLFIADTFTHKNGTIPTAPERPSGRAWTIGSGTWEVRSRKLVPLTNGSVLIDSGMSDLDISCVVSIGTSSPLAGMIWRGQDDSNRFGTFINRTTSKLQVYRTAGGFGTVVAETDFVFDVSKDYWLRTIVKGNKVANYINGVKVLDYTVTEEDSFSANTLVGLRGTSITADSGFGFYGFAVRRV